MEGRDDVTVVTVVNAVNAVNAVNFVNAVNAVNVVNVVNASLVGAWSRPARRHGCACRNATVTPSRREPKA